MTIIERNNKNLEKINKLYEENKVLFEHCILESENYTYSICYCPQLDVYDVILETKNNKKLINYESRKQLSSSTLKYFNTQKDDNVEDMFGNNFKCITHHIEIK